MQRRSGAFVFGAAKCPSGDIGQSHAEFVVPGEATVDLAVGDLGQVYVLMGPADAV